MQNNTLISYIIPVYNIPLRLLTTCIESILSVGLEAEQEIIVVDDGSDTPVEDILPEALQKAIHCIRQPNAGAAAARNVGLDHARGKYIQFVDADDHLIANVYTRLATYAIECDADLLMFRSVSSEKEKIRKRPILGATSGAEYMLHHYVRVMPWGYLFKKDLLSNFRFTAGSYYEDEEFTPLLLLKSKRMFYTLSTPYFYNQREGSLTHCGQTDYTAKRFPDFERIILKLHQKQTEAKGVASKALKRRVAQITEDYVYNIMRFTHNYHYLCQTIRRLRDSKVFPLPKRGYGIKYTLFRWLIVCVITRRLLTKILR